ncbi:hypothetical protein LDO31_04280 [Luteimonas sp. XNQY3]|nr:DUF6624 domain-containing protein [Luteimonas sp. XNQY3]MCD9005465.1 hypothetical protein [Luteimonas sp. XNQY3]
MRRTVRTVALLALASAAGASPPSFMDGVAAYEAGDPARCGGILLAAEVAGAAIPTNGELLTAECLSAAGRFDDAFAYLRRQLPGGRIPFDDLLGKSRPGLDALRQHLGWNALRTEAATLEAAQAARRDPALREELLRRAEVDQVARRAVFGTGGSVDDAARVRMTEVDRENTAWLQQVLDSRGWPDSDLVGHDGAKAAWLLVQHADHDPAFQRAALARMQPAVDAGRADRSDYALLTDRVLLAEGQPQRYGTQFQTHADGVMRLRPVEDPDGLEARRAAVGLPSMADYRQILRDGYGTEVE